MRIDPKRIDNTVMDAAFDLGVCHNRRDVATSDYNIIFVNVLETDEISLGIVATIRIFGLPNTNSKYDCGGEKSA
jgi:hypothetical protein